jgi:hypothetical protein
MVLITATVVGTVAWYGRRSRRVGGSVRPYVVLAVVGGLSVPTCYVVAGLAATMPVAAGMVASVGLPLLGLGALLGAWAYFRRGSWRRAAAVTGVVCLVSGVATVLGAWSPGLLAPVLIAAGLLTLAWYERSRLLTVVACAVAASLVLLPVGMLSTLVPAVIVLAAAILALARRNSAGASAVPDLPT